MTAYLGVILAGALGAPLRYLVDSRIQSARRRAFPLGTLVVNVSGSLVLGVVTGLALYHGLPRVPKAVLGAGFCGAYTTFSTHAFETVRLAEDGARARGRQRRRQPAARHRGRSRRAGVGWRTLSRNGHDPMA